MIELPNNKVCYNLPEQVAANLANIEYLAEHYKNLDEAVASWPSYKAEWDQFEIDYANWTSTLEGYLTSMSSAAVSAIAGQNIAPANISATNSVSAPSITGDSIVELMSGYTISYYSDLDTWYKKFNYIGIVKNGNKLTLVVNLTLKKLATTTDMNPKICGFNVPQEIADLLFPVTLAGYDWLDQKVVSAFSSANSFVSVPAVLSKGTNRINIQMFLGSLVQDTEYVLRIESTFLLSDNLAA